MRENDIDFQSNELGCELGEAFAASLRPAIFDRDIAALGPTQLTQSLHKSGGPLTLCGSRARAEQANGRQLSPLLRARRNRPRECSATEKRDELPPPHSITSSARARKDSGIVRPIAFAALTLTTSSNLLA